MEPPSPWADEPVGGWATTLGVPAFEVHDLLPSTNDRLRELAGAGAPFFTTVVARSQSHGRGREGRRWYSTADCGLWISTLLPAPLGEMGGGVGVLPLAVGVAAARAVERVAEIPVSLKWPNDLLLSGGKFGGILCEAVRRREGAIVVGVGINLRRPSGELPGELQERVSFLEEVAGHPVGEASLAAALLQELHRWTESPPLRMENQLLREWEARDALRGHRVRVGSASGEEGKRGVARGLAPEGYLLLEGEDGQIEAVVSGTVRMADGSHP